MKNRLRRSLLHDSLRKITWNATRKTVIYRSKRHATTKRNFEIFKAPDIIAAIRRFSGEWAFKALQPKANSCYEVGQVEV